MTVLVTGATGELGSRVVAHLAGAGADVRGISRRGGAGVEQVDLLSHRELTAVFDGVDTIVHCAQGPGKSDVLMAHRLAQGARRARVRHLVAISIVGIDDIPLGFYRQRVLIERALTAGFNHVTIQRATQFHSLVSKLFDAQRRSPVIFLPKLRVQPIDSAEVAARLAQLASTSPQGRAPNLGGPEIGTFEEFFEQRHEARGLRRRRVPFRLPSKTFRAFESGAHLTAVAGQRTFQEFVTHPPPGSSGNPGAARPGS